MSGDRKGQILWWICLVVVVILFIGGLYTFIHGVDTGKKAFWIGGLGAMGAAVTALVSLYGHMRGPKP